MNNLDKIKDFAEKFDKFRDHLREECTTDSSTNSDAHKENKNKFNNFMEKEIDVLKLEDDGWEFGVPVDGSSFYNADSTDFLGYGIH